MTRMSSKADLCKRIRNFRAPSGFTDDTIERFFFSLNCPRSLTCWLLYENREFQQLVDLDVNPNDYNDPFRFRDSYAATSFLSKADFIPLAVSKQDAAFKKFFEFENLCKETNARFRLSHLDPLNTGVNLSLLNATIRKMDGILGEFSAEELIDSSNWGPGSTTILSGDHVSAVNKFDSENGVTRDLYALMHPWFKDAYPRWHEALSCKFGSDPFAYVVGNKIVTVPKNSKTDRVIAIEPGLNLWFQKGIGSMIRRRLARKGIDLNSQVRNQELSRLGSLNGSLATVDFSSASDSISKEVVRTLVSSTRWLTLLESCRSVIGVHNDSVIRWEKFSSMGNGFTFELESLIFYAAALAACESMGLPVDDVSVFGDDVILPTECFDLFSSFCAFLGFIVNPRKSFKHTAFRESCGAHYFEGVDVKPLYLKRKVRNAQAIYSLANGIRRLAHRRNSNYGCDARLRDCWASVVGRLPREFRLKVSDQLGDSGISVNFDEACPPRARRGFEGFLPLALLETGINQFFEGPAMLLARLKTQSHLEYGNFYTLRGRTRLSVKEVLVHRWYNYGPWF